MADVRVLHLLQARLITLANIGHHQVRRYHIAAWRCRWVDPGRNDLLTAFYIL